MQASTTESPGDQAATSTGSRGAGFESENFNSEVLDRLQTIQSELRAVRDSIGASPGQDRLAPLASNLKNLITPDSGEGCVQDGTEPNPDRNVFNGGPSLLKPWNALQKRVGKGNDEPNSDNTTTFPATTKQDCLLSVCSDISECYLRELRLWNANVRHQGVQAMKEAIDVYFSLLNPHCKLSSNPVLRSAKFIADSHHRPLLR